MPGLYQRRVEQEWRLLEALVEANPDVLGNAKRRSESGDEVFSLQLDQTTALMAESSGIGLETKHQAIVHFPRFFPSVPIEVSLLRPVFHPNVHPENGFVCLWDRFSSGDTVVEAMAQLQSVLTWKLWNEQSDNVMQPLALEWFKSPDRTQRLPLICQAIRKPEGFALARTYARRPEGLARKRLS